MKTIIIEEKDIKIAAALIREGKLVAFPTETVYGIGANALNKDAIKLIYLAKRRPQENPLIMHVNTKKDISKYAKRISSHFKVLMKKFMPGALTLVLKKKVNLPSLSKLETVAIRIPENKIALQLIKLAQVPIVAPSANISSRPSTTSFEEVVKELNGIVHAIIKTNTPCEIGIESTVITYKSGKIVILRPGFITKEDIEKALNYQVSVVYNREMNEKVSAPGMLFAHYKPKIPVKLFKYRENLKPFLNDNNTIILITDESAQMWKIKNVSNLIIFKDLKDYAKNLYSTFRCYEKKVNLILCEHVNSENFGYAINDRLIRASENTFLS